MKLLIRAYILFFIVTIGHSHEAVAFDRILGANVQNMTLLENVIISNNGVVKEFEIIGKDKADVSVGNACRYIVKRYGLFSDYGNPMRSILLKFRSSIGVWFFRNTEYASLRNIVARRLPHVVDEKLYGNWQPLFYGLDGNRTRNNIGTKLDMRLPPSETNGHYRNNEGQKRYWAGVWIFVFVADIIVAWFVLGWYFRTCSDFFIAYILIIWFIGFYAFNHILKHLY